MNYDAPDPEDLCDYLARGFCPPSIDGYCIGGYRPDPAKPAVCHG